MKPDWLPNWRDKSAYPNPKKTSDLQWAWEFLRRNTEYQKDFDNYGGQFHKGDFAQLPLWLRHKYHLAHNSSFPNPASPMPAVRYYCDPPSEGYFVCPLLFQSTNLSVTEPKFDEKTQRFIGHIRADRDGIHAVHFDINSPIEPQIKRAKEYLINTKKKKGLKESRARNSDDLINYLRVWDAKLEDKDMPSSKIASVVFPDTENDYANDYPGNKSVGNAINAAKLLIHSDYRNLYTYSKDIFTAKFVIGKENEGDKPVTIPIPKAPDEVMLFVVDWSNVLAPGERIVRSTWELQNPTK